jgi:hypothetical protein
MRKNKLTLHWALIVLCLGFSAAGAGKKGGRAETANGAITAEPPGALWRDPVDIASRDLFYGPGGKEHEPTGTFTFIEEDLKGTSPKFVVHDQDGVKWKVKLGGEARPETAATRLVWAAGYFANQDYFLARLQVANMPARLRRGQKFVAPDGSLENVRLKRYLKHEEKKVGNWSWRQNPFTGTRQLNALRVLMALINNWDLTDENNAIYEEKADSGAAERIYMISDLGSSFGAAGLTWPVRKAKDNLDSYRHSRFIGKIAPDYVDFHAPSRDSLVFLATPREFVDRLHLLWIGRHIPRADAKWIGQLLAQLSPAQIGDAFRAAGYSPEEVEGFTAALRERIAQLAEL